MGIPTLNATVSEGVTYTASLAAPGAQYSPTQAQGNPRLVQAFSVGTTAAGQINEIYSVISKPAASGTTTLDLTSLTDVLGQSFSFARIKAIMLQLLNASQDSANGTACSSVSIGAAATNAFPMFLAGTTPTVTLLNGEGIVWLTPQANGITVDGTHKNLLITNNDGAIAAAVQVTLLGSTA